MARADSDIGDSRAALPPDLPDDFEPEPSQLDGEASADASVVEDLEALFADGKTYLQAEVAYQKSRAGYAANRVKWAAIYGAAVFALLHLALIGLTVGIVFALIPLVGPWLATGIVVAVLLLGALAFALKLRDKIGDMRAAFEGEAP